MAYGNKYSCVFSDLYDREIDLKIKERDYSSSVFNLNLGKIPIVYTKNSKDTDHYSLIEGSTLEITIICQSAGQYDELNTSDAYKYKVVLNIDSALFWEGYIKPNLMDRPVQTIYEMTVVATDGLGYMKNIEFRDSDGEFFDDYVSAYYALWYSISKITADPLSPNHVIRCGANVFETNHNTDISPLTQTYIPFRWFIESHTKAKSCWTVVEEILKVFFCKIYYYYGFWNIVPRDIAENYTLLKHGDSDGTIIGSDNITPALAITGATAAEADRNVYLDHSQRLEIMPAYKSLNVVYDCGYINDLFTPLEKADFHMELPTYPLGKPVRVLTIKYDSQIRDLKVIYTYFIGYPATGDHYCEYILGELAQDTIAVNVSVNITEVVRANYAVYIYIRTSGGGYYWLMPDGSWSTARDETHYGNTPTTIDITSDRLPNSGTLGIRFSIYNDTNPGAGSYDCYIVCSVGDSKISLTNFQDDLLETKTWSQIGDANNSFIPDDYKITLGDLTIYTTSPGYDNGYLIYKNMLFVLDGSDYIPSRSWSDDNFSGLNLGDLIAKKMMKLRAESGYKLSGNCMSHWMPYHTPTTLSRTFLLGDTVYDIKKSVWGSKLFQVKVDPSKILLESGDELLLEDGNNLIKE